MIRCIVGTVLLQFVDVSAHVIYCIVGTVLLQFVDVSVHVLCYIVGTVLLQSDVQRVSVAMRNMFEYEVRVHCNAEHAWVSGAGSVARCKMQGDMFYV